MNTIQNILESHETDKHNATEHSYGDFYASLFSKYNREGKLNILELGIQRGGSLFAWREFFPNANIWGVDIVDDRLDKYKFSNSIVFIKDDLKNAIHQFKDIKFDIIIDDSDHNENTMAWIGMNYFPLLNQKGTLVFEDVQIPDLYERVIADAKPANAKLEKFDMRHIKGRPDDFIITLTKR